MLAQGLTRNTFIGGEGCTLSSRRRRRPLLLLPAQQRRQRPRALDAALHARAGLGPRRRWQARNAAAAASPRPRRWLEDGKTLKVERAPTAFGPVSVRVQSRLSQGEVIAEVDLPARNPPKQTLLRLRVPDGWRLTSAKAADQALKVDERGTVDVSSLKGKTTIRFQVNRE